MKIYVVETFDCEGIARLGFSTSKEIAKAKCMEFIRNTEQFCWIGEYSEDENFWCEFDQ